MAVVSLAVDTSTFVDVEVDSCAVLVIIVVESTGVSAVVDADVGRTVVEDE